LCLQLERHADEVPDCGKDLLSDMLQHLSDSPPCFSQYRPQQFGLFGGKPLASLWLAISYLPAEGWRPVPAEGSQAAYPKTNQLVGVYFG